jgi:hypothetical protein
MDSKLNMQVVEDRGKIVFKNNSSAEFDNPTELCKLLNLINMGLMIMPKQIGSLENQKAQIDLKIEELKADIEDKQKRKEVIEQFLASKGIDFNKVIDELANQRNAEDKAKE